MLVIAPDVAAIIIAALEEEIARQEAIGAVCGEDWPDDYEPNDVVLQNEQWRRTVWFLSQALDFPRKTPQRKVS